MSADTAELARGHKAERMGASHDNLFDNVQKAPPVATTSQTDMPGKWEGPTYYGRSQLKAAPFNNWVVGGYIFLAGLSGGSAVISTLAETARRERAAQVGRRGRYLAMLAPTVGSLLLIWDLHTPQRFYNMWRIAKATSPMSIGTWILTAFIPSSALGAAAQFLADVLPAARWLKTVARIGSAPSAVTGSGLSVYTASLLAATSTPYWAAAPRALAVRFGASSIASGAAALVLAERDAANRDALNMVLGAALATEAAATVAHHRAVEAKGVGEALKTRWGKAEKALVEGVGIAAPIALHLASHFVKDRKSKQALSDLAAIATLVGSAVLRVSALGVGEESARRPEVSFRFSQPENLPKGEARRAGPAA
jgi:formate-dependent nitrite reductase membrane component NrfD